MLGLDEQEECMGGGIGRRPGILRAGLLGQVGWIPGVTQSKGTGDEAGSSQGHFAEVAFSLPARHP